MKNDTSCCDNFDKHNDLIIEFKPCEIAKQFDVNINMGDCTCLSPITPCPLSDTDCCNNIFLLMLLVILVLRNFILPPCDAKCCNSIFLLILLVALVVN